MEALKHIRPDFKARFCGDIPLHSPCLGRIYVNLPPKKSVPEITIDQCFGPNKNHIQTPTICLRSGEMQPVTPPVRQISFAAPAIRDCWYWCFRPKSKIRYRVFNLGDHIYIYIYYIYYILYILYIIYYIMYILYMKMWR